MNTPEITLKNDRILVERKAPDERTKGGMFVPDTARERQNVGYVVAVGPGRLIDGERIPPDSAVGDFVLFGAHAGSAIKVGGVEYQLLRDDDVIGTLPEPGLPQ